MQTILVLFVIAMVYNHGVAFAAKGSEDHADADFSGNSGGLKWRELDEVTKHMYQFEDFILEFQKEYQDDDEMTMRQGLFNERLQNIHCHNAMETKSWQAGVNSLTE